MRNVITIYRKELHSYFASPIAYALMAFFAVISGYFFYSYIRIFVIRSSMPPQMGGGGPMDVNDWVVRPMLLNLCVVGLFLIPLITMRLFAEEKRSGTIELLATSPVRDIEIILGKWFAAVTMYAAILALSGVHTLLLFLYGKPDVLPVLTGYLGLVLQGSALLALGTFLSTTTRNQIIAGVATFGICLLLWVIDWPSSADPTSGWAKVLSYLSVIAHFEPFSKGVIDSKDFIFYATVIILGLFLSARSLESLRWRA
jgi:ABC-2 type transport system permease protein